MFTAWCVLFGFHLDEPKCLKKRFKAGFCVSQNRFLFDEIQVQIQYILQKKFYLKQNIVQKYKELNSVSVVLKMK